MPKLIMAEATHFPALATFYVEEVIHRARRLFATVIRRGVEQGEFREDLDVDYAVRLALGTLTGALSYKHSLLPYDSQSWDFERYLELHIDIFLRGIAKITDKDTSDA